MVLHEVEYEGEYPGCYYSVQGTEEKYRADNKAKLQHELTIGSITEIHPFLLSLQSSRWTVMGLLAKNKNFCCYLGAENLNRL